MPVIKKSQVELSPLSADDVIGVSKANIIGESEGWYSHTMRLFNVQPGGHTPRHAHPWEHVNYITQGHGHLRMGGDVLDLDVGDFAFVPPNTEHQFENSSDDTFQFICIVPNTAAF